MADSGTKQQLLGSKMPPASSQLSNCFDPVKIDGNFTTISKTRENTGDAQSRAAGLSRAWVSALCVLLVLTVGFNGFL